MVKTTLNVTANNSEEFARIQAAATHLLSKASDPHGRDRELTADAHAKDDLVVVRIIRGSHLSYRGSSIQFRDVTLDTCSENDPTRFHIELGNQKFLLILG
jgi:hypothetical protein